VVRSDLVGGLSLEWESNVRALSSHPVPCGTRHRGAGHRAAAQATSACFVQRKGSLDRHMACIVTARRRAKATLARRMPRALAWPRLSAPTIDRG
jgi:hypothetical protein